MGQNNAYKTSLPLSACPSACTLALAFLDGFSFFTKIGTDVKNPKRKNEFVGVNIVSPLLPPPKNHANINNNPITALNVRESSKFSRTAGHLDRRTQW